MLWINVVVWFLDSHDYSTLYFILTPGLLVGSVLLTLLIFFSSPIICLYVLSSTLWYPLRFPHENDVRFVLTSNCLYENSCLIYLICVCLRIVVSKTYCVVFLFCLSSSCLPYVARFSRLCCVFVLLVFVLFTLCCQVLWVVHFWLPLRYSLTFIYTNISKMHVLFNHMPTLSWRRLYIQQRVQ
jgi:hypothetical protein